MAGLRQQLKQANWKTVAIIALIFLLAFGIRGYLMRYDLMFEFDTYWHTRMTGEIIQHGALPAVDPLAYYQLPGGSPIPMRTELFWYISAFFYFIASLFTTGGFAYSKELLIAVVKFLPAFYGAIVCLGLYFLGKEAYGKKAGYLMAFFGAVSASFIYRSMAGFFEAGTLGYVFMVFGFYFVLRAVKRKENQKSMLINMAIAGILFAALSFTYGLFMIVPLVLAGYLVLTGLDFVGRGQSKEAIRFVIPVAGSLVVFFLVSLLGPDPSWIMDMYALVVMRMGQGGLLLPMLVIVILGFIGALVYQRIQGKPAEKAETAKKPKSTLLAWAKLVLLYLILIALLVLMFSPKPATSAVASGVGEESPGYLYFFHKFGVLILLPILALVLAPLIDFKRRGTDVASMLFFIFTAISLYMAWDRLHYSYNFGVPLAIAGGYVMYHALIFFKNRARSEKVLAGICIGFMVFAGVASATLFTQNNIPTIETNTGWKEGLYWLKDNTPAGAKVFNWWDEGHWITFLAEKKAITDNRNFDMTANSDVGKFVVTEDLREALGILKKYDSDYLVLGADLFMKRNSMIIYAFYIENPVNPADPRFDSVSSVEVPCSKETTSGAVSYQCGGAAIAEAQMNSIPAAWTSTPSAIEDNRNPVFYYRSADNAHLYKLSLKINQTIFAKIWFKAPETTPYFEEVFPGSNPQFANKELKIFKINKEKIPAQ